MALLLVITALFIALSAVVHFSPQSISFIDHSVNEANWRPKQWGDPLPEGRKGQQIKYGYKLVSETPKWMGPMVESENLKFAGNNLACKNCHLDNGTKPGAASWVGITNEYPQFRARENKKGTIEERINGCMERSMNGQPLPVESSQMKAIVAYMEWLSEDVPRNLSPEYQGFPSLKIPNIAADPVVGKQIYIKECQVCHAEDGQGVKMADETKGYQFPPVWGLDSYNHGAGMNRVITAAQFIKGNMPHGQATWNNPKLTDEEALHVAAYIDSFNRPLKPDVEMDFPDLKLKPVSTPYGPWEDHFSEAQHKYGPYPPIMEYYEKTYGIKKNK